ncbi:MAG: amidohydrolase, partial [Gammaproteobacteria bacterium]|nr:amidohydrolase [Gammaproteobacteria bacterium]
GYSWTGDEVRTFVALNVGEDGAVVATYSSGETLPEVANRYDGQGATLLPGLIDAHGHVLALGQARNRVDLVGTQSLDDALKRIVDYAGAQPQAPWILGRGWNQVLWPDQAFPSAADLDRLAIERPVWLRRIDGHAAWANSVAMAAAGISASTPDPHGGVIARDENGEPTGLFVDTAMELVERVIPDPTRAQIRADLQTAFAELLSLGLTSVHDAGISLDEAAVYSELDQQGELPLRIYAMLSESAFPEFGDPVIDDGSGHLAIRSVKAYLDGALGSRGAALKADYSDDPGNRGLLFKNIEQFDQLVSNAVGRGFQVNVHAIGDAANHVALEVFDRHKDGRHLRHRIEHAQIIDVEELERFAETNVIASMQPTHATSDKNMAEDRVGPQRIAGGYAWRKLLDRGAHIAAGSDFPVEPANPMFGLHAAVSRQDRDNQPPGGWYPQEALTPAEALRVFTLDAAFAAHQEQQLGSLEPGKRADFILVDRDILKGPADQIWQTKVLETWVNGRRAYQRPAP